MTTEKVLDRFTEDYTSFIKSADFRKSFPNVTFAQAIQSLKDLQVYNFTPALEEYFFCAENLAEQKSNDISSFYDISSFPPQIREKYLGLVEADLDKPILLPYNSVLGIICADDTSVEHYISYHAFSKDDILIICTFTNIEAKVHMTTMYRYEEGQSYETVSYLLRGEGVRNVSLNKQRTLELMSKELTGEASLHHRLVGNIFLRMTDENEHEQLKTYKEQPLQNKSLYIRENNRVPAIKMDKYKPVYIVLDKNKDKFTHNRVYKNSKIEHVCSWIVRGHYRRLHNPNSLGIDRFGKRTMQGKTWIAPYRKGDENLPLKKVEKIVI